MHPGHQDVMSASPAVGCQVDGHYVDGRWAAAGCAGQVCFQVRVEASAGRSLVRHWANACAAHLGELVEGAKAWARNDNLTDGTLTVLVIDPAAESRRAAGGEPGPLWPGFAFAALALTRSARR